MQELLLNFAVFYRVLNLKAAEIKKFSLQNLKYPIQVYGIIEKGYMKQCIDSEKAIKRLRRIQGQIGGIIKMMEQEKDCEDILIQIGAAKAGLHKTGQAILEGHLRHCVMDAVNAGKGEAALKKLSAALEQFSRIV